MAIPSTAPFHLAPPLIDRGTLAQFQSSGQTVSTCWSNRDSSLVVFASNNVEPSSLKRAERRDQSLYLAHQYLVPRAERRVLITDSYKVYAVIRELIARVEGRIPVISEEEACLEVLRKLNGDLVNMCKNIWASCTSDEDKEEPDQLDAEHYRKLCTCMSLFCVLYLPEPGFESAPASEDLMEWLNEYYVEPSTAEGQRLTDTDHPWEDEYFWPFLQRAILRGLGQTAAVMLDLLSGHPSPHVQELAQQLIPILLQHPRVHEFTADREMSTAHRRWREKVKTLRIALDRVPEDVRDDEFENWWQRISDIVGVLEGQGRVARRLGKELGVDWREICVVWCLYIDPRIKRQDLPDIVADILEEFPPDPTNPEEVVQSWFFMGKSKKALESAALLDPWLPAHLAELMEALDLIDRERLDSELTLREFYVLSYAEYIQSNPSLWRITVAHMRSCGTIGKEMADQVLMRVPLKLRQGEGAALTKAEANIRAGHLDGDLREVISSCAEYGRESTRREICKIAARTFLSEKQYGLAISYCMSAEDWPALGRIVECVLEEYVQQGAAIFAHLVANITPSREAFTRNRENSVFIYRLEFAVRFAEFHHRRLEGDLNDAALDVIEMIRDGIAPKAWWAVVLHDIVELLENSTVMLFNSDEASLLLHTLEEIYVRSAHGAGSDYLEVLGRITKTVDEKHTLQKLQVVRLALAKYFARCGVYGVGGRQAH